MTLVLKPLSKDEFIAECDRVLEALEPQDVEHKRYSNKTSSSYQTGYFLEVCELAKSLGENNTFYQFLIASSPLEQKKVRPEQYIIRAGELALILESLKNYRLHFFQEGKSNSPS